MLEQRLKELENEVQEYRSNNEPDHPLTGQQPKPQTAAKPKKKPTFIPAPPVNQEGDVEEKADSKYQPPQSFDWAEVVLPKKRREKRPNMSDTTEQQVNKDLISHFNDKYRGENVPKTRAQKMMTPEQRQEAIDKMLDKSGYRLGIAPFTTEHMQRVDKILSSKGLYIPSDTPAIRKKKTVKAIIKIWAFKNLLMT